ncbi:MAG: tRNA (guanosine(37)-N1)-methyltransferase TrmD [Mycobacteriales bacterium]
MRIDAITIFPDYLAPMRQALLGRAIDSGLIEVDVHDLRAWTHDAHRTVDDPPYGGGPGMVMRPEPWHAALSEVAGEDATLIVPTPAGTPFRQHVAAELATAGHLVFACGRYEGIDQRVIERTASRIRVCELSIGDYVLAGGEAATLVMVEAISRLVSGVVGNAASITDDSHADGLLEGPSYTRPEVWAGRLVPPVLLSGNHAAIVRWRRDEALRRTKTRRPDLIAALDPATLDERDRAVLGEP